MEKRDHENTYSNSNPNLIPLRVSPPLPYQPCMYIYDNIDWEVCEELRLRECEEVKAKAAQMENKMHWWSDCTGNWRKKWSTIRAEKNKAYEEGRQLKLQLEESMKELNSLKKINEALLAERAEIETQNIWKSSFGSSEKCWIKIDPLEKDSLKFVQSKNIFEIENIFQEFYANGYPLKDHQDVRINLETPVFHEDFLTSKDSPIHCQNDEIVHISVLLLHMYKSQKILQKEQKIRSALEKEIEKVKSEKSLWKWKYEELQRGKQGKQVYYKNQLSWLGKENIHGRNTCFVYKITQKLI
ncbi:coiled-coil domain-containing protein 102B isoform X1 [Anolis carolinensis]|uniref:coiled-coil domain-containing protein 102B isoform X1 n=1 Tax=Anolis carolinensis TaxID=28377 RepID=UPI002F2B7203